MIFVQTKKVWLVGLGQEGFERGLGGNYLKYLKRGGTERRGGNRKIFKKGGKLGQGVGALKRRGGGLKAPLRTMSYKYHIFWNFVER